MSEKEYSKEAKQALGKSRIDIGVSIYKSVLLSLTTVPIMIILNSILTQKSGMLTILKIIKSLPFQDLIFIGCFYIIAIIAAEGLRSSGLKQINESHSDR